MPDNALLNYMRGRFPFTAIYQYEDLHSVRGTVRFMVPLFRSATGEMAALIEADALGRFEPARHGCRDKISRERGCAYRGDYRHGLSGADSARSCRGRALFERVRAFGEIRSGARQFCREMSAQIGIEVEPVESGEKAGSWCGYRGYGHLGDEDSARRALAFAGSPCHAIGEIWLQ